MSSFLVLSLVVKCMKHQLREVIKDIRLLHHLEISEELTKQQLNAPRKKLAITASKTQYLVLNLKHQLITLNHLSKISKNRRVPTIFYSKTLALMIDSNYHHHS